MQPPNLRKFETRRERRKRDRSVKQGDTVGVGSLPEEGRAVVREATFECPCRQCANCGGQVSLTAVLWVDDWPVNTPEAPEQAVTERPEGGARVRSLHLSLAPTGLEEQRTCSAGCEISPGDWERVECAALLSMCEDYHRRVEAARAALRKREKPP